MHQRSPVLLVVGVLLGIAMALPSSAAADEFTTTPPEPVYYPASLTAQQTGEQHHLETTSGVKLTCDVHATGTLSEPSSTLALAPSFSSCSVKVSIFIFPATVAANGCEYALQLAEGPPYEGPADLACPEGEQIEVLVYQNEVKHGEGSALCELALPAQEGLGTVEYENEGTGGGEDVRAQAELTGVEVTRTGSSLCGAASQTATYTGALTVTAEHPEGEPIGLMAG